MGDPLDGGVFGLLDSDEFMALPKAVDVNRVPLVSENLHFVSPALVFVASGGARGHKLVMNSSSWLGLRPLDDEFGL